MGLSSVQFTKCSIDFLLVLCVRMETKKRNKICKQRQRRGMNGANEWMEQTNVSTLKCGKSQATLEKTPIQMNLFDMLATNETMQYKTNNNNTKSYCQNRHTGRLFVWTMNCKYVKRIPWPIHRQTVFFYHQYIGKLFWCCELRQTAVYV